MIFDIIAIFVMNIQIMKTQFSYKSILILAIMSLLIFNSNSVFAQNWRSVNPIDTSYFYIVTNSTSDDTMFDGYLRSIYIVSSSLNGNIETSILPYSTRMNAIGNIDTTNGDSWLGHLYIRDTISGEEIYFNQQLDSIKIHTLAGLNSTWKMSTDLNGIDYYATVLSLDTTSIDGTLDSIKTITIQAFSGINPVSNYYNNFNFILSKSHGFKNAFEVYAFPYYDSLYYNIIPYPKLQFTHKRLDKSFTHADYNNTDLVWKYTPGNEWMIEYKGQGSYGITHDSIISSNLVSPDSIAVTYFNHRFSSYYISSAPLVDTMYHIYTTKTDTIGRDTFQYFIHKRIYETPHDTVFNTLFLNWTLISFSCNNRIIVTDTVVVQTPLSGNGQNSDTRYQNFGKYNLYHYYSDGVVTDYWENHTFYSKLGSCTDGTKLNFKGLSTNDIDQRADLISLYPNPSSTFIQIMNPANIEIKSYTVKNITGGAIASGIYTNLVDISRLPNGLYFIEFKTKSGILTKKFIKS